MANPRRSDEKKDKPRADFSNVRSGGSSTAPARPAAGATVRTYTVKEGDSLSLIAQREYGDVDQWRRIFEANRDVIDDPDFIYPGQTLQIP